MDESTPPARRHGIPIVPEPMRASLGHLPASASAFDTRGVPTLASLLPAGDVPFWRPGLLDILSALRWRWVILGPCLAIVLAPLGIMAMTPPSYWIFALLYISKFWVLALGGAITLLLVGQRRAVSCRRGDFCIHCGYDLDASTPQGACPECGRAYIPGLCDEYRKDPSFFRRRYAALRTLPRTTGFDSGA